MPIEYQYCLYITRWVRMGSPSVDDLTAEAVAEARKLGRATFIVDEDARRVCRRIGENGAVEDVDEPIPDGW